MKIYEVGQDVKCGGCNWEAHAVYFAADSQEEADEMFEEHNSGICSDCLVELFVEEGYGISLPANRQ